MIIRSPVQASVDNIVPQWVGTTLHGSCLLLVYTGKYLHFIFHTHLLIALIALIERRPIYRSDLLVRNSPIWPPWALYREYLHSLGSFCSRMRYSAHEHTVLYSNVRLSSASTALPHDIVIEALVSLVIVSAGLVLGAEKLKPISWSEWAGEIEREGGARNPYLRLEERYSFWDIRAKRKEFAEWVRGNDALEEAK
ncbi:hypothetical protein BA78_7675 [Aspergillus fumigatus]|nr:hypothetical protein BA78_7675 [Aspergillus fumigatus]